jgi:hypothetical protein
MGCLELLMKHAGLWNGMEQAYYRLHRKLKGDIYC